MGILFDNHSADVITFGNGLSIFNRFKNAGSQPIMRLSPSNGRLLGAGAQSFSGTDFAKLEYGRVMTGTRAQDRRIIDTEVWEFGLGCVDVRWNLVCAAAG